MSGDPFRKRHAVVTGGSSGIGRAIVHRLVERGARVSVVALDDEYMESLRAERLEGVTTAVADVSDPEQVDAALTAFETMHGPIDLLITCAGIVLPGYFQELPDAEFERDMAVNYFGTLHAIRRVTPGMIERGSGTIVSISSTAGLIPVFGYTAYGPSKYAVRALGEILRTELKPHGIHVACVFPSDVDTPQLAFEAPHKPPELIRISGTVKPIPPERVADAVLRGIEKRRAMIFSDAKTKWLFRLSSWSPGFTRWFMDREVRIARKRA